MLVLHLEDDGPLREILAVALKAAEPSCEIHQFIESDTAIQYAVNHVQAIDLFILDIRVPGSVDGLEVARRVRAMNCLGTIVLTSAYRAPDPQIVKELNCEWFPKPWHIYETITKLVTLAQKKNPPEKDAVQTPKEKPSPPTDAVVPPSPAPASTAPASTAPALPPGSAQPVNEPESKSPQTIQTPQTTASPTDAVTGTVTDTVTDAVQPSDTPTNTGQPPSITPPPETDPSPPKKP